VRTPEKLMADGVLRVAVGSENHYPYLYWNEQGECAGIEADVARALTEALTLSVEFIPLSQEDAMTAVEDGLADIGFAGFVRGATRGGLLETASYYTRRPFVLTRRGEFYPSEDAMENRVVLSDGAYQYSPSETVGMDTGIARLLEHTADAIICDEFAAVSAAEGSGEALAAELLQRSGETSLVAIMARQNGELYSVLDGELEKLLGAGKIAEIAAAYY
jgi:ABC-type amino acid transport substrate-binding protein